jgi:hypothetical protein
MLLRIIFGPKKHEIIGGWKKLYNEVFKTHTLRQIYVIRMMSRRMRWAGHVALMGRRGIHIDF